MPNTPLNPDALEAAERWMQEKSATFGLHWKNAKPIIEAYLAVAQPVVNSEPDYSAYRKAPWPVRERPEVKP